MQDVGVLWNMLGLLRHVCDENWKRLDQRSFYLSLICRGLGCAHLVLDVGMEAGGKVPECKQLMSLYAIQDVVTHRFVPLTNLWMNLCSTLFPILLTFECTRTFHLWWSYHLLDLINFILFKTSKCSKTCTNLYMSIWFLKFSYLKSSLELKTASNFNCFGIWYTFCVGETRHNTIEQCVHVDPENINMGCSRDPH